MLLYPSVRVRPPLTIVIGYLLGRGWAILEPGKEEWGTWVDEGIQHRNRWRPGSEISDQRSQPIGRVNRIC